MTNVAPIQEASIGHKIDTLFALREKKRAINTKLKDLETEMSPLEAEIMSALDAEGTIKTSSRTATVSISEQEVPSASDWEKFNKYVRRNNYFHLYQRRVSATAFRELLESRRGKAIPGIESVTVRKLNLRKATT